VSRHCTQGRQANDEMVWPLLGFWPGEKALPMSYGAAPPFYALAGDRSCGEMHSRTIL
jgi:hypothetical protein